LIEFCTQFYGIGQRRIHFAPKYFRAQKSEPNSLDLPVTPPPPFLSPHRENNDENRRLPLDHGRLPMFARNVVLFVFLKV